MHYFENIFATKWSFLNLFQTSRIVLSLYQRAPTTGLSQYLVKKYMTPLQWSHWKHFCVMKRSILKQLQTSTIVLFLYQRAPRTHWLTLNLTDEMCRNLKTLFFVQNFQSFLLFLLTFHFTRGSEKKKQKKFLFLFLQKNQ